MDRFDDLWTDYLEGKLGAAGISELQELLTSRPDLLDRALGLYEVHRALGLLHQAKNPSLFARATADRIRSDREGFVGSLKERLRGKPSPRRTPWAGYGLIAAATLVFSWVIHLLISTPPLPALPSSGPVATLVQSDKALWEPEGDLFAGRRLSPGPLRLSRGSAVLLFDSGAIVALHGPADFEIESRGSARLRHGRITVRADQDAIGFTVHTPAGEAVDLGTEFAVAVELSGATEIHVQQGEVAWGRKPGHPPSHVLKSGQAMRFDPPNGAEDRSIAFSAQPLDDFLRRISYEVPPSRPTAFEDFEYDPGTHPPATASGGSGWAGPWRLRQGVEVTREPDLSDQIRILPESLQGSWFPDPERGGALALPPGQSFLVRGLADPVDLGRDAVYYMSFLVRREPDAPPGSPGGPRFRLTLRSSQDYWGTSIALGLPISLRPAIEFHTGSSFVSPTELEVGATTLWVVKIVASRSGPDEIFLKVFKSSEALPRFEPAPWSIATGPFISDGRLDLIVVTGTGPATHVLDGLRVGRTWESVTRRN